MQDIVPEHLLNRVDDTKADSRIQLVLPTAQQVQVPNILHHKQQAAGLL